MCYTYDDPSRVTLRTIKNLADDSVIATETFSYDAAGNITGDSANTTFAYDTNNRLISFNGNTVSYDLDGNMLSNGSLSCTYDSTTGQCSKTVDGINYVILNGDFNKSAALANDYKANGFGKYNFLFHNCSDYTNELLDVADVDGLLGQISSEGNKLISIPVLREAQLSVVSAIDSISKAITDGMINTGKSISGINTVGDIAGGLLALSGSFIDETLNFVGDVIDVGTGLKGEVVDFVKQGLAVATNVIADGAKKAWDWISFWD